jgi:hypothetical protein
MALVCDPAGGDKAIDELLIDLEAYLAHHVRI